MIGETYREFKDGRDSPSGSDLMDRAGSISQASMPTARGPK
jgi:hypothetical protein